MNRSMQNMLLVLLALCISLPMFSGCVDDSDASDSREIVRNVIFMVPDGMGISNVTAGRTYQGGPDGDPLSFETLPYIGYQRTHSKNSFVTDSAAAGSAWACGAKFNNGEISCHDDDADGVCDGEATNSVKDTVLEIAQGYGMATGLVATSDITHATPAVFAAHVHNRKCESEIFEQMYTRNVNVLLGGGIATNRSSCMLDATDDAYNELLIADAQSSYGYSYVTTKDELDSVDGASTDKLLGLFKSGGLTPQYQKSASNTEPTLAEMTEKALEILEQDPEGFFLMVEGSQIDWADHARNLPYMVGEVVDFADAVQVVRDWIDADETRAANTLLIVVADHETGGASLDGPYGSQASAGNSDTQAVDTTGGLMVTEDGSSVMAPNFTAVFGCNYENYTASAEHTAEDTVIWSNHSALGKALDNTDLYDIMDDFMAGAI